MINDIPDDFVPRDDNEMIKVYKQFVGFIVRKYNRVDTNYDDLLQHVWIKIIEVKLIEKYHASGDYPKEMTGEDAAAFCQVSWIQWKVAIWRGIHGDHRQARDLTKPDERDPALRRKISWMPTPVSGTWASKKSMYRLEDIEMLMSSGYFRKKHKTDYICPRSRCKFKPYLARAIHNIWSNWCRTRSRKYKEQYLAPLEDGTSWESLAADPLSCRQEASCELSKVVDKLDKSSGGGNRTQITELLASGRSLVEIVQELSLPKSLIKSLNS